MKEQNNSRKRDMLKGDKILRQCNILGRRLDKEKSNIELSERESIKSEFYSQTSSGFLCNILAFIWLKCNEWLLCTVYINEFTCVVCCLREAVWQGKYIEFYLKLSYFSLGHLLILVLWGVVRESCYWGKKWKIFLKHGVLAQLQIIKIKKNPYK